jgi:hypothetical protein
LLRVLGLDSSHFLSQPGDSKIAYRLILGRDYQPCFQPSELP